MQFEDQPGVLPAGLDSFYWLSFLSAGILGGSMANKKKFSLCALCVLCGEKKTKVSNS
jgi:hypothetical protein